MEVGVPGLAACRRGGPRTKEGEGRTQTGRGGGSQEWGSQGHVSGSRDHGERGQAAGGDGPWE